MSDNKTNKIYIIYPGVRPSAEDCDEWFTVKPFKQTLLEKGYDVDFMCLSDYTIEQFTQLPVPAGVVFNHIISFYAKQTYAEYFEIIKSWDTVFLNDVNAQYLTSNKSIMYSVLEREDVGVPKTITIQSYQLSEDTCNNLLQEKDINYPVVVKPAFGVRAAGTSLCYNYNDIMQTLDIIKQERNVYHTVEHKLIYPPVLVQEYINEYPDMFIRVCVLPGYVGGFVYLVSPYEQDKFATYNNHKFRVAYKVDEDLENIIKKAMAILNVNAACIDVLICKTDYKITDINCFGNLSMNIVLSEINLYQYMVDFLDERIRQT